MSFCHDIKSSLLPVYKSFTSSLFPNHDYYFVFVGKQEKHIQDVLEHIEKVQKQIILESRTLPQNTKQTNIVERIKASDHHKLKIAFGSNYISKLGISIVARHNTINLAFINNIINDDDSIITIKQKLTQALKTVINVNVSTNFIYIWCKYQVVNNEQHWESILNKGLFHKSPYQSVHAITTLYKNITGNTLNVDLDTDKLVDATEAVSLIIENISKANRVTLFQTPMGLSHQNDGNTTFIPANPLHADPQMESNVQPVWEIFNTIECYKPFEKTFHVCFLQNSEKSSTLTSYNFRNCYFPSWNGRTIDGVFDHEKISELSKRAKDVLSHKCMIDYVQLRNMRKCNDDAFYNIDDIFVSFRYISHSLPFVKKTSRQTGSMVKMHKSMIGNEMLSKVESWVKAEVFKGTTVHVDTIVFKINLSEHTNKFATLTLQSNGICDLKFKFGSENTVNINDMINYIKIVNNVLDIIDNNLIKFDINIFATRQLKSETVIVRMTVVSVIDTNAAVADESQIYKSIQQHYTNSLTCLSDDNVSPIHIVYNRVDSYGSDESIALYIARQKRLNNNKANHDALSRKIKNVFNLNKDEALHHLKQWKQTLKNLLTDANYKAYGYIPLQNVNIHLKSFKLNYKVSIDGLSSIDQYQRIIRLLKCVIIDTENIKKKASVQKQQYVSITKITDNVHVDDIDDDDDVSEWTEMFKKWVSEEEEPNNAVADMLKNANLTEDNVRIDKKNDSYVLNELKKADRDLFAFDHPTKSYAKSCQKATNRQPIVITTAELESQKNNFPNYLSCGSSADLAKKNHYICPDVWCPKSRTAMTYEQYKKNKNKCPNIGVQEDPILFFDHSYWQVPGETGENAPQQPLQYKKRYVDYLPAAKHPKGFCMPCCYKQQPKAKLTDNDKEKCNMGLDEDGNNEKYIKASTTVVNVNRYAVLPKDLNDLLENKNCKAGLMSNNTKCFFRKGVVMHHQSFLNVVSSFLDDENLSNPASLIKSIDKNMSLELFMSLENGWLCKKFISTIKHNSINDQTKFNKFLIWYMARKGKLPQEGYLDMSNIAKIVKSGKPYDKNGGQAKLVLRAFVLYSALTLFKEYLNDDNIIKTHEFLVHLFNLQLPWLNNKGYNFLVVETNLDDEVYLPCKQYTFRNNKPFVLLFRVDGYYEPIVFVNHIGPKKHVVDKFLLHEFPQVKHVLDNIDGQCDRYSLDSASECMQLYNAITDAASKIKFIVIDYDFHIVGFIVSTDSIHTAFLPLQKPANMASVNVNKDIHNLYCYIFVNDIGTYGSLIDRNKLHELLNLMNSKIRTKHEYFNVDVSDESDDYIVLKSHKDYNGSILIIPLNYTNLDAFDHYNDDMYMMIEWETHDKRTLLIDKTNKYEGIYAGLWNEAIKLVNASRDIIKDIILVRNHANPLPLVLKRNIIDNAINKKTYIKKNYTKKNNKIEYIKQENNFSKRIHREQSNNIDTLLKLMIYSRFHNRPCSSIGNKLDCIGQCVWLDAGDGGVCRLNCPETIFKVLYNRLLNDLCNPFIPLRPKIVSNDEITDDIIILTAADIKNGKIKDDSDKLMDAWGFTDTKTGLIDTKNKRQETKQDDFEQLPIIDVIDNMTKKVYDNKHIKSLFDVKVMRCHEIIYNTTEYNSESLYEFFSRIYNHINVVNDDNKQTANKVKDMINHEIINAFIKNDQYTFNRLLDNNYLVKNKIIPEIKDDDRTNSNINKALLNSNMSKHVLKDIINNTDYHPAEFDIEIVSKFMNILVVQISRSSQHCPDSLTVFGGIADKTKPIVIIQHSYRRDAILKHDKYMAVTGANNKIIFENTDFTPDTWKIICNKTKKKIVNIPDNNQ